MTNNKEQWEQELQMGLDRMDSWVSPSVGDLHMWEQLIVNERHLQRRKLVRELSYFWMIAAVVLILGFMSMTQLPIVYVVVQVATFLGFPLLWVLKVKKQVSDE